MPTAFMRSMRSVQADRFRGIGILLAAAMALALAWGAWFTLARIAVYEVTDRARVEVDRASHPVESPVEGRVVVAHLALGREVAQGDVLVELDAADERLRLEEERARIKALAPQMDAIAAESAAEARALDAARGAGAAAIDEAQARLAEVEAPARFAEQEADRLKRLRADGVIAEVDELRTAAEAQRRRAVADSARVALEHLRRSQLTEQEDRRVRLERLQGTLTQLRGQLMTSSSTVHRVEHLIEQRRIRAPISGQLGDLAELREGSFVAEGQKVAAIVPDGHLRIVAEFAPAAALGRIRPRQAAELRLVGFPWTEYGAVPATVDMVASEVRAGTVRVELSLRREPTSAIPFQHGLPGTVQVEVERASPSALLLRAAGRLAMRAIPGTTTHE